MGIRPSIRTETTCIEDGEGKATEKRRNNQQTSDSAIQIYPRCSTGGIVTIESALSSIIFIRLRSFKIHHVPHANHDHARSVSFAPQLTVSLPLSREIVNGFHQVSNKLHEVLVLTRAVACPSDRIDPLPGKSEI